MLRISSILPTLWITHMTVNWKGLGYSAIVLVVGVGVGTWMIKTPKTTIPQTAEPVEVDILAGAPSIAAVVVKQLEFAPQLQLYSQLRSTQQVSIKASLSSDVLDVLVAEGDTVKAGARLVTLDTAAPQRQLSQLQYRRDDLVARRGLERQQFDANKAALPVEQNLLDIAQRSVDRLTDLKAQRLASISELESAERTLQTQRLSFQNRQQAIARFSLVDQQFQAQLAELDSQIDQAKAQLSDADVVAPFAGVVSQVQAQKGATVNAGTVLLTLVDPKQQRLEAWVSANAMNNLAVDGSVRGVIEVDGQLMAVKLQHIDPAAEAGSLRLFFQPEQSGSRLTLNRHYRLWLDMPKVSAFAVPASAVYSNRYVYHVSDNALSRRTVVILGERFENGQLWRLVAGELENANLLVTRLQNAAQGLAVRQVETLPMLAGQ